VKDKTKVELIEIAKAHGVIMKMWYSKKIMIEMVEALLEEDQVIKEDEEVQMSVRVRRIKEQNANG
jgi:hypothetical protein